MPWTVTVRTNGEAVDVTDSDVSPPVTDKGAQVGELTVEKVDPANGVVELTLTPPLFAALGRYST